MADLNATVARKRQSITGEDGNLWAVHYQYNAAAAAIGDVILLGQIPVGAKVVDVNMRNAALGADSTVSLGYRAMNPNSALSAAPAAYLPATSTAAAATTRGSFAPIKQTEDLYLIATVADGAITGLIDVVLYYIFEAA